MIPSGGDDIPTEVETRSQTRRRRDVLTRLLFLLAGRAPVLLAGDSRERSQELLADAFDNCMYQFRWGFICGVPRLLLFSVVVVPDNFSNDPAANPINARGHQLVTFCSYTCAKEEAQQFRERLMGVKYYRRIIHVCSLACVHCKIDCSQD